MPHRDLLSWFELHARPFLELYAAERVQPLVSDARRLQQLLDQPDETLVACLGNSGVGKSTLINALVAGERQLLPAGGTGPLTALATTVRHGEQRRFRARYHQAKLVWQILFPIEAAALRDGAITHAGGADSPSDIAELIGREADAELDEEEMTAAVQDATTAPGEDGGRLGEFVKMACKLVTGDQFAEVSKEYLVDCLRVALDRDPRFGLQPSEEHRTHLERVRSALALARSSTTYERGEQGDLDAFLDDLAVHAVGNLAPLIAEIEVEWPSELLRDGLVFVDLPGIGVAGDMYRARTQEFVRERAKALLLVVDRAGMSEASLDLLRSSGYWDRLVGAAYEPEADPSSLLIAVTKVDDVVEEESDKLDARAGEDDDLPEKHELFEAIADRMRHSIRQQTAQQLSSLGTSTSAELNEARAVATEQLLLRLQVHPVIAPDYRRLAAPTKRRSPRVATTLEQTQIPRLASALRDIACEAKERRETSIRTVRDRLTRAVLGELSILASQWKDEQRVVEEAEQLRAELDRAVRPWREELANREGGFREFLQDAGREKVATLIIEARDAAQGDIRKYLRTLRGCPWNTLRAAVQRGGTFSGSRKIDLPNDIAERFQEPMAGVWGMRLLRDVRKRTQLHAQDCVTYVVKVCEWARAQGSRVNPAILDRQEQRIADQAEQLRSIGKEAADELRAVVRSEVSKAVLKPIERRCKKFVDDGDHVGPGVKNRILDMLDELAEDCAKSAEVPAKRILTHRFEEVRAQIEASFDEWRDPIQETVEAIVSSNEQRLRRADAKRRVKVLAELQAVSDAQPAGLEAVAS